MPTSIKHLRKVSPSYKLFMQHVSWEIILLCNKRNVAEANAMCTNIGLGNNAELISTLNPHFFTDTLISNKLRLSDMVEFDVKYLESFICPPRQADSIKHLTNRKYIGCETSAQLFVKLVLFLQSEYHRGNIGFLVHSGFRDEFLQQLKTLNHSELLHIGLHTDLFKDSFFKFTPAFQDRVLVPAQQKTRTDMIAKEAVKLGITQRHAQRYFGYGKTKLADVKKLVGSFGLNVVRQLRQDTDADTHLIYSLYEKDHSLYKTDVERMLMVAKQLHLAFSTVVNHVDQLNEFYSWLANLGCTYEFGREIYGLPPRLAHGFAAEGTQRAPQHWDAISLNELLDTDKSSARERITEICSRNEMTITELAKVIEHRLKGIDKAYYLQQIVEAGLQIQLNTAAYKAAEKRLKNGTSKSKSVSAAAIAACFS
ncbi:Protein of unknown function [Vibrio xiamenensis]|uniref:Uncharacterized protein n=1 Tax=Vibrio xiamenensis TaxID=861298 RepID=A0A1G8CHP2_9VIBR|nr:hypothetical protein [Vibrio xiamenensis]SDH44977.1 Protein of unknown function [Vibrio xiamenensis]